MASGRLQDAITWLHTDPVLEAKRKEAREARMNAVAPSAVVAPSKDGAQSPEEPK